MFIYVNINPENYTLFFLYYKTRGIDFKLMKILRKTIVEESFDSFGFVNFWISNSKYLCVTHICSIGHGILGPEGYALPMRPMPCLQHPHLQLRGVEASGSDGLPLLRGITLEAGAAEVLAIMATTEKEGTQIVETIAGRRRIKRGDILLNGRSISARSLRYLSNLLAARVRFLVT